MSTSTTEANLMWSYDAQAGAQLRSARQDCKSAWRNLFPTAFCKQTKPSRPVAYIQQMVCRSMMLICIRNESVLGLEPRISCSVVVLSVEPYGPCCCTREKLATLEKQRRRPESERLCHRDGLPNIDHLYYPTRLVTGIVYNHSPRVVERGRHLQVKSGLCMCLHATCLCLFEVQEVTCVWVAGVTFPF
jgi:hypothetical protein